MRKRKELTVAEEMKIIFSLGVYEKKRPLKAATFESPTFHPQPRIRSDANEVKRSCESTPVGDDLTPLTVLLTGDVPSKPVGGFGTQGNEFKPKRKSDFTNRSVTVPDGMFSLGDVAEYLGTLRQDVRKVAGLMGMLERLPGRNTYAPITEAQAKVLIQHFRLRSALMLRKDGVLAKSARGETVGRQPKKKRVVSGVENPTNDTTADHESTGEQLNGGTEVFGDRVPASEMCGDKT